MDAVGDVEQHVTARDSLIPGKNGFGPVLDLSRSPLGDIRYARVSSQSASYGRRLAAEVAAVYRLIAWLST
jgi:hypothetical protein